LNVLPVWIAALVGGVAFVLLSAIAVMALDRPREPVDAAAARVMARALAFAAERAETDPTGRTAFARLAEAADLPIGWTASLVDGDGIVLARWPELAADVRQTAVTAAASLRRPGAPASLSVEVTAANAPATGARPPVWRVAGGVTLALALAVAGAVAVGRILARPLRALVPAVEALGAGTVPALPRANFAEADAIAERVGEVAESLRAAREAQAARLAELGGRVRHQSQELAAQTALYRVLADNTSDVIVLSNVSGVRRYVSPSAQPVLGYAPEELVGRSVLEFIHPEDRARVSEKIQALRADTDRFRETYRFIRKDGQIVWIESAGRAVIDPATGALDGYVAAKRDITDRILADERASRAIEEAQAANRAKSEFLASMSHELRTPLNAVSGFAQILALNTDVPAKQRQWASYIVKGARQLLSLVNDVLDLARIDTGRMSIAAEPVAVAPLLVEVTELLTPVAADRDIVLRLTPPPDGLAVFADRARLLQVLLNIGSNAIKYNFPGGSVTFGAAPAADGKVRLSVTDTGKGISNRQLEEIFDAFNRLGEELGDIEGTGIGLTIARKLAELMDGQIGVESEPGRGSLFWVDLPATEASAALPRPVHPPLALRDETRMERARSESAEDTPTTTEETFTVLYVEDNADALALMEDLAALLPVSRVMTAPNGTRGLQIAFTERLGAIILDINLPDMTGYDILARLRADPRTARIPVIGLSADAMPDDVARARSAGFDEYLTKPFDFETLMRALASLHGRAHGSPLARGDDAARRMATAAS
jgi:PAS domain S-box-containing protein